MISNVSFRVLMEPLLGERLTRSARPSTPQTRSNLRNDETVLHPPSRRRTTATRSDIHNACDSLLGSMYKSSH